MDFPPTFIDNRGRLTKYYGCFSHYTDEEVQQRIAYWESAGDGDDFGVLPLLYVEQDLRVDQQLLAWVEGK